MPGAGGFPANNFGSQEPGTNQQIKEFCSTRFGVTFPMSAKISVRGDDIHPLCQFLTTGPSHPEFTGRVTWSFNKFLVSRDGDVIRRYDSPVEPLSSQLISDVEAALKQGPSGNATRRGFVKNNAGTAASNAKHGIWQPILSVGRGE